MSSENKKRLKEAIAKTARSLYFSLPILVGVILLVGLANTFIPKTAYSALFSKIAFLDAFIGAVVGSVLAGNPVTSYVVGGELLNQGIGLVAVTAFIVAWVTVGVVQFPAESILLGKKFAIARNAASFGLAIVVAIITVAIMGLI